MRYSQKIFRAYDIRGKYPKEVNAAVVSAIASALGKYAASAPKNKKTKKRVILGCDNRKSSPELYQAALAALRAGKAWEIHESKLITAPMLYFLVNHYKADLGIIITASHNPAEYNGLKAVGRNAEPISGEQIRELLVKSKK